MDNMENKNKIEVEIFNQKFTLFSEVEGEKELRKLADFVDKRMRDIYQTTKLSSALKIAILTALNLADELLSKTNNDENNPELVNKIFNLVDKMNNLAKRDEEVE